MNNSLDGYHSSMTTAHSINIPLELVVNINITRLICTLPNSPACQTTRRCECTILVLAGKGQMCAKTVTTSVKISLRTVAMGVSNPSCVVSMTKPRLLFERPCHYWRAGRAPATMHWPIMSYDVTSPPTHGRGYRVYSYWN